MSSWHGDNPFDYLPPQSQRYWQRNDLGSFIQGPPSSYARNRMQTGFRQSHLLEEPMDRYNRNRMQPGFPHSRPLEEPTDQYNRSRVQPGFPQSSPPEEPADLYNRSRVLHGFPHSRLSEEATDWYNRNRIQPGFLSSEEPPPPSFQSSQNPGFQRSRLPSNSRRLIGGALFGFTTDTTLPTRVTVYEEVVRGNGFATQPQPGRSSIPRHMQHQRNRRQSPGDESKLTIDEQNKVLSKLRKEKYNPATPKQREEEEEEEEGKRCSVCLEDFEAREEVTVTPCRHMFHGECIVPWVTKEGSCPVCRSALLERKKSNVGPPAVDRDLLDFVRALALDDDDDVPYQNMIPLFLLGR